MFVEDECCEKGLEDYKAVQKLRRMILKSTELIVIKQIYCVSWQC